MIVGIDEAGRGPLAGPLVCVCVALPKGLNFPDNIKVIDSKKLNVSQRLRAFRYIVENAYWAVEVVDVYTIDRLNIRRATLLGMSRVLEKFLDRYRQLDNWFEVLVDGKDGIELPAELPGVCQAVVKGDMLVPEISCASILAKVIRDGIMKGLDVLYPEYGFSRHKGYATAEHIGVINRLGPSRVHRRSYEPVSQITLW